MSDNKTVTFDASQWQLVPKVPTEDMVSKAQDDAPKFLHGDPWYGSEEVSDAQARAVYAAMLAAAPTPAAQSADSFDAFWGDYSTAHVISREAAREVWTAAQSAGQEAAALTDDHWLDLAQRHANADWNSDKPDGFLAAVKALCEDFANIYAAPVNGGEPVFLAPIRKVSREELAEMYSERDESVRYEALEREHFGDPDKRTGIYADRAADAQQVDADIRGEVAYQLHTRNRWLDMPTMRAIVDSAFDAAIAKARGEA